MFQLVCIQNGQVGMAEMDNEKEVLGEYETREEALRAAEFKFKALKSMETRRDKVEGTPDDFVNTVKEGRHATYTDHYFIEEV